MNKVIGLFFVIAIVIGVGPYARSLSTPAVPPGISAGNWIALGDAAGFVITNGDSLIGSTSSVGVARGYFMLRRGGTWLRIDTTPN